MRSRMRRSNSASDAARSRAVTAGRRSRRILVPSRRTKNKLGRFVERVVGAVPEPQRASSSSAPWASCSTVRRRRRVRERDRRPSRATCEDRVHGRAIIRATRNRCPELSRSRSCCRHCSGRGSFVGALAAAAFAAQAALATGTLLSPPRPLPPLALVAQDNQPFEREAAARPLEPDVLRLHHCPDVCPMTHDRAGRRASAWPTCPRARGRRSS